MAENKNLMMLLSIVQGDMGVKLIKTLTDRNIRINFQFVGHGTAPTEMMDIFGLSTNNKDIVVSIGAEQRIKELKLNIQIKQLILINITLPIQVNISNMIQLIIHHGKRNIMIWNILFDAYHLWRYHFGRE